MSDMEKNDESKILLEFLKKTRDGEYCPINNINLEFVRIQERTVSLECNDDDDFYYSIV